MNPKMTLSLGVGLIVVGLLLCLITPVRAAALSVLLGCITLGVLLGGLLFVFMGYVQVKEDRDAANKEAHEAQQQAAMAAKPAG